MEKVKISLKIIFVISILITMLAMAYISLPNLSYAIDNARTEFNLGESVNLENVYKINVPSNSAETVTKIREHRGHAVWANSTTVESYTYDQAIGNTGIKDINSFLAQYLNNVNSNYGWYDALKWNTSVYCRQKGQKIPSTGNRFLNLFHDLSNGNIAGGKFDANNSHLGNQVIDHVEKRPDIGCTHDITISSMLQDDDHEEVKTNTVNERELDFEAEYKQKTYVRLNYKATPLDFDTQEGYYFSYSKRLFYQNDPAQVANWIHWNYEGTNNQYPSSFSKEGIDLYKASMAVDELKDPTKPQMSVTSDSTPSKNTGTVIDGSNYKIGPIYMNDYTYGWCNEAKDFSGELICGLVEAKLRLDSGKEITLNASNFSYSEQDTNKTTFVNTYYESPSLHDYQYPTPNSKFYINIPISECVGATKVEKVTMKYKWTTADGKGGLLDGTYDLLEWTGVKTQNFDDCHYDCTNHDTDGGECNNDGLPYVGMAPDGQTAGCYAKDVNLWFHNFICSNTGYCEHGWNTTHYNCSTCDGGDRHYYCGHSCDNENCTHSCNNDCKSYKCDPCSKNYCKHGHINSIHVPNECKDWGAGHIDRCHGNPGTGLNAREGSFCPLHGNGMHRTCCQMVWTVTKEDKNVESQRLMYVTETKVDEHEIECYIENIPLVTKVEINKYIYDVEHIPEKKDLSKDYDSTMSASDVRKTKTENQKEQQKVYVEYGDLVTYKIVLKNESAFGVKVRTADVIPDKSELIEINIGGKKIYDLDELRKQIIQVQAGQEASYTVTVQVEALEGEFFNTGKIITRNGPVKDENSDDVDYVRTIDDDGPVVNHIQVNCNGTTQEPKLESKDWYILNDYDLSIYKYVSSYDAKMLNKNNSEGFTNNEDPVIDDRFFRGPNGNREGFEDDQRLQEELNNGEDWKRINPFEVEKTEKIIYSIRLTNEDEKIGQNEVAEGGKQGTQVRPTRVRETFDNGLKYEIGNVRATIFKEDGSVKMDNIAVNETDLGNNSFEYYIGTETILDPGDMLIYFVTVEIEKSNMYLPNLKNEAFFTVLTNVNDLDEDRIVYNRPDLNKPQVDRNINNQEETKEYVKQKELIIAGKVFIDKDRDGIMEDETAENRLKKVPVTLYRVEGNDGKEVGQVETDNHGFYTFERVDKADDKQNTKSGNNNYYKPGGYYEDGNENYFEYYIEFEYDGVVYKVTEVYGGRDETVNPNYGENNIDEKWLPNKDGSGQNSYIKDSNAYEFTDVREDFNKQFETIGYNKAYAEGKDKSSGDKANLSYDKDNHESKLVVIKDPVKATDPKRVMTARSFIEKKVIPTPTGGYTYAEVKKSLDKTKTLWLYNIEGDEKLPETEYLKYINLGLVEREDVNVSLVKDVYSVTTTVNGEQITYDYNKNGVKNNEIKIKGGTPVIAEEADGATEDFNETNGKYIDNQKYSLELYESDYYYRVEQYEHQAVRDYKTIYSELNIEVRITITNEKIENDEDKMNDKDREIIVTIDEIADYYDENFVEYTDNIESAYKAKLGTPNEDADYKYMTQEEADTLDDSVAVKIKVKVPDEENIARDPGSTKLIDRKLEVVKAWYYKEGTTNPTGLIVTNKSNYNPERESKNGEADGYRKLYIRGFNKVQLHEGESIDLYVKYIVDKEATGNILSMTSGDSRNLKIAERLTKGEFGRGQEGIAEISAYSTWYQDYERTGGTASPKGNEVIPAGLVDRNSNPDNLGDDNSGANVSIDNVGFYEDDTYKTGIEMTVPKPENPPNTPDPDPDPDPNPDPDPDPNPNPDPDPQRFIRKVSGRVWDDSRSNPGDNGNTATDTQYSGNGYLRTEDTKNPFAKMNDNVTKHYNIAANEEKDIMVRNARVDLIEIVQIGDRYYEEMIRTTDNTVHQYTTRTDENGNYVLYGFKPGYYIVRFGYGDYVEGNQAIIDDMAIFNGQDYKSTKYTSAPDDEYDNDNIIRHLEEVDNNDARDDEIDRLNTISYSEIMINQKAEILKGNYVRDDNTNALVQTLLRNTAMNAETVKFMVKPEKMTGAQMDSYKFTAKAVADIPGAGGQFIYYDLENMMNEHIHQRDFSIENVNFGIEYRPESQVNLVKEIDNVSLITSDGNEILKLYVNTNIERDPNNPTIVKNRVHTIDTERSIGMDKTQFLTNEYTFTEMRNNILDELLEGQGFVYVNVDDDILQGSTVTIQYRFTAENVSEIDRIGKNLNDLRFKDNSAARTAYGNTASVGSLTNLIANEANTKVEYVEQLDEVWNKRFGFIAKGLISDKLYKYNKSTGEIIGTNTVKPENTNFYDTEYTGSGTAGNILIHQTYKIDENMDIYRVGLKKKYSNGEGYYGKYLGDYYYTAEATDNDVIAQIKFDKILDYVDNDLVFSAIQNAETNGYWGTTTATELKDGGYLSSLQRDNVFQEIKNTYGETHWGILDRKGISFDSVKKANPNDQNSNKLEILKTNLAVSISDRTTDDSNEGVKNLSMSRFLTPAVYDTATNIANGGYPTEVKGIIETPAAYYGQVMITVSKLISEETLSEDMAYENLAEIIQFTVTSGRRTNFITTIGNAKIENGEWSTSTEETDTSAAERITFTPPTGLTRTDRAIRKVVEKSSQTLMIVAVGAFVVAVAIFTTRFITIKIKKRRIK